MRHLSGGARKLNRNSSHRIALKRAQATSLFRYGRIKTTLTKAKDLRPYVEKLITKAKGGDLHSLRMVGKEIQDKEILHKIMDDIAPAMADRSGGYTRIYKLGFRRGDAVQEAYIELVNFELEE